MEPLNMHYNITGIPSKERARLFHNVNSSNMEISNRNGQCIVKLVAYAENDALRFRSPDELNFYINKHKPK